MKHQIREPLLWVIIILLFFSGLSFTMWLTPTHEEGTLNIDWNAPKGIKFSDMRNGDEIFIEYRADSSLSLYFVTQEQAAEYRSSSFYKKELPTPLTDGNNGKYNIVIDKDGDYELLFWNESFTRDHNVEYEFTISSKREGFLTITASIVLLFISIMILIILIRKSKI